MKYKIWDRVRIVEERVDGMDPDWGMDKYLWKIMTISSVTSENYPYKMVEDEDDGMWTGWWVWWDQMIEWLADEWTPKEGEIVNAEATYDKVNDLIYLFTLKDWTHICVTNDQLQYIKDFHWYNKITKTQKKERKLMMTDKEWDEFKKNNNLN
jgi:hypothetical protein